MEQLLFNTSFGLKLSPVQVATEIVRFMCEDTEREYKVTLGTDSMRMAGNAADFVTAIVVHRVGRGGRYFWRRIEADNFHTLRDRITHEVLMSLDIAKDFLTAFDTAKKGAGTALPRYDFEIHVDVGENGATKAMIQELVGMVRAYNLTAKTKPDSYAASHVADKYT